MWLWGISSGIHGSTGCAISEKHRQRGHPLSDDLIEEGLASYVQLGFAQTAVSQGAGWDPDLVEAAKRQTLDDLSLGSLPGYRLGITFMKDRNARSDAGLKLSRVIATRSRILPPPFTGGMDVYQVYMRLPRCAKHPPVYFVADALDALPLLPFSMPQRELRKVLSQKGFRVVRQNGSHEIWQNEVGKHVSVPERREYTPGKVLRDVRDAVGASDFEELRRMAESK